MMAPEWERPEASEYPEGWEYFYLRHFWWIVGLRAGYGWRWFAFWFWHGTLRRPVVGGRRR